MKAPLASLASKFDLLKFTSFRLLLDLIFMDVRSTEDDFKGSTISLCRALSKIKVSAPDEEKKSYEGGVIHCMGCKAVFIQS